MSIPDSYLFEIGWVFFAAWSVIIAVLLIAAFGRDLLGSKFRTAEAQSNPSAEIASVRTPNPVQ